MEQAALDGRKASQTGFVVALAAHVIWGVLPLYFLTLAPAGAFEIVAWRVVFSLGVCAVLLAATRGWGRLLAILRTPRLAVTLGLAAALVSVNWTIFVLAALTGQVVEASLGYFVMPLATILLGVLVFRERLRPMQWAAIAGGVAAGVVLIVGHGTFPWIALGLAGSFSLYGLVKKRVGAQVDALSGFAVETVWLLVPAVVVLGVVAAGPGLVFGTHGVGNALLLVGTGPMTAAPLLLFAAAARRLQLTTLGFVQYLTPVLQFVCGVVLLHEEMPPERWLGFGLVWVALGLLSVDVLRSSRRRRLQPVLDI